MWKTSKDSILNWNIFTNTTHNINETESQKQRVIQFNQIFKENNGPEEAEFQYKSEYHSDTSKERFDDSRWISQYTFFHRTENLSLEIQAAKQSQSILWNAPNENFAKNTVTNSQNHFKFSTDNFNIDPSSILNTA